LIKSIFTIPNILTMIRIVGAVAMLFVNKYTMFFYVLYSICGISDLLDGFAARMTNSVSEFGAKLDTAADLLFYSIVLLTLLPDLWVQVPLYVWCLLGVTLLLRLISYGGVALKYHRLAAMHTYLNKCTSMLTFLLAYFINHPPIGIAALLTVLVALLAVIEELSVYLYLGGYPQERVPSFLTAIKVKQQRKEKQTET